MAKQTTTTPEIKKAVTPEEQQDAADTLCKKLEESQGEPANASPVDKPKAEPDPEEDEDEAEEAEETEEEMAQAHAERERQIKIFILAKENGLLTDKEFEQAPKPFKEAYYALLKEKEEKKKQDEKIEEDIKSSQNYEAEEQALLKRYGPGYVKAQKGEQVTVFTAKAWGQLVYRTKGEWAGTRNGWRPVTVTPPEVLELQKKGNA